MTPQKVLEEIQSHNLPSKDGCVYFCGTLLMEEGKFLPGEAYDMSLEDPVLNRKIDYSYTVTVLKDHITYFKL